MTEYLPRRMHSYESEYARQKKERAKQKTQPADLLAQLALENCGGPVVRPELPPGEPDRGSYRQRMIELLKRRRGFHSSESYQDEGWC